MTYGTLPSRFLNAIDSSPTPRAQMFRHPDSTWESISSAELLRRVSGLSMALVELGVKPGDRVALFAANRPEWHTADFAINGSGGVQLAKFLACRADLPELEHVIVADGGSDVPTECLRYETLIASAAGAEIAAYRMRTAQVLPGQLCSIIYTSGTTGEPKGVMLTHHNMSSNVTDSCATFDFNPATDTALSFLPLAHVYGRMLDYNYLFNGVTVAYVEAVDLVAQALLEIQPTVIAAVPRFFEKIYSKLMEQGSKATGSKRKLFDWAVDVARRAAPWRTGGKNISPVLKAQWALADKLVYKKVRAGTGGKLRMVFSGGAPLSKDLAEFFWSVGIPIYQGYGLTETSPILTSNYPKNRSGSSGRPIPNVLIRIAHDGEVLAKGPCVMQGYYKNQDATREAIDGEGWFHTGDVGHLDADNYLFITDRKKDLIKTAGGKFVAPQPIENALKTSPYITNAMIVGDQRRFVVALIVPNPATVSAKAQFSSNKDMAANPAVYSLIEAEVKRLTAHVAQWETLKRFALLPEDFTFDNGSLTFTLKLKRRVVEQNYREIIDKLYADTSEPVPSKSRP